MDATVNLMSLMQSEGGGKPSARVSTGKGSEPTEPFENVLEKASETREATGSEEARPEKPEDHPAEEVESGKEEEEDEKDDDKDREPAKHAEVVVPGGINLVVQQVADAAGQDGGEPQPPVVGSAVLPANGDAEGLPLPAQPAGEAGSPEVQAKLAAMQAKVATAQAQVVEGQIQGDTGEEAGDQPQTLDRGAAAKAALDRLAAGAKGESAHKLAPVDQSKAGAQQAVGEGSPKAEPLMPVPSAVAEKPAEVQLVQPTSSAGAERADSAQAFAGLGKVEARAEGIPGRNVAGAGQSNEPTVNRQEVMDQVVRSARLHLERGLSRFEMRLDPPSLGRLKVVMDLKDGALNISFKVESQAVKEALQNSLPQLREALAAQGLTVDGFDVQGSGRGAQQNGDGWQEPASGGRSPDGFNQQDPEPATVGSEAVRVGNGLVDCWA